MICDTSALLSAFSADQKHHEECAAALENAAIRFVSPLTLNEIDFIAEGIVGRRGALTIMRALAGPQYRLLSYTRGTLIAATAVMETHEDMNLGIVDASLVAHAREVGTEEIFTLDQKHFRSVRSLTGRHFRLIPFDL
jgi:predicted nucleic acid-binding protein